MGAREVRTDGLFAKMPHVAPRQSKEGNANATRRTTPEHHARAKGATQMPHVAPRQSKGGNANATRRTTPE